MPKTARIAAVLAFAVVCVGETQITIENKVS
jgi:hypothetical protein